MEQGGEKRLLTAAHLADGADCDGEVDKGDYFHQKGQDVGRINDFERSMDYVTIDNDSGNHNPTDKIQTEGNTKTVNGVYTKSAVSSNLVSGSCGDDEEKVFQMGVTTGVSEGCITAYQSTNDDDHVCWNYTNDSGDPTGIEFGPMEVADMDSGGPVYVDNGWVYMVAMFSAHLEHQQSTICNGRTVGNYGEGPAAYSLQSDYGMVFDLNLSNPVNCDSGSCTC